MSPSERPLALITGASRGIGRAIALRLAQDGYCVAINYCSNQAAAEEVQASIAAAGGASLLAPFDLADTQAAVDAVRQLSREVGRIDVLVNNAAIIRDQPLVRMRDEDWHAVMNVNLHAVYACTKSVLKSWAGRTPGRRIINIVSVAGEMGNANQTNYAAAKAGLIGFTKALARELASKGVTVNAVSPGLIETDGTQHLPREAWLPRIPLGRLGRPEEIAHVVGMLASPQADYITGQVIRVDGGLLM